ncbi:MAG TPA: DUF1015 family protein [Thermoleophilaceae bacterium]|nr:DUF1015 family protein [Thermoleophilaceae bacterium]
MAEIRPLRAVRYEPSAVGSLDAVAAPPYDVIDAEMRAALVAKSPFNVVEIDLPEAGDGADPYLHAQTIYEHWLQQGILVREREDTIWALTQSYEGPDGRGYTRHGFFARVRVEEYGEGRIRPHERTHPGPKQDRLDLTRATRANLSPIFSLFPDPEDAAWAALEPHTRAEPFDETHDEDGTHNRLWRILDPATIERVTEVLADRELLIADGHHRYETARVYAEEVGGEGEHRYVLMFLCNLGDSGLTVFPTHRLLTNLKEPAIQERLGAVIKEHFDIEPVEHSELEPPRELPGIVMGYMDSHLKQGYRLTLKPGDYHDLDTRVLEDVILRGALGMSDDDIDHKHGLDYSKDTPDAVDAVLTGRADAAFYMRGIPVEQIQVVAGRGENMPPKSTYFYPKIPTGLVFNPLE